MEQTLVNKEIVVGKTHVEQQQMAGSDYQLITHPVLQHKLTLLRDYKTNSHQFRMIMEEIGMLMAYDVSQDLHTSMVDVETPLAKTQGVRVDEQIVLVSILRAGNGMLEGMLKLLSFASVGHVGIYRDKFVNNTVEYYFRLPNDVKGKTIFLLDPILATGDTAVAAITRLKQYNVGKIRLVSILVSKPGFEKLKKYHPDVEVYTLSVEPELDEKGYIIPGIGDAGDRLYFNSTPQS